MYNMQKLEMLVYQSVSLQLFILLFLICVTSWVTLQWRTFSRVPFESVLLMRLVRFEAARLIII